MIMYFAIPMNKISEALLNDPCVFIRKPWDTKNRLITKGDVTYLITRLNTNKGVPVTLSSSDILSFTTEGFLNWVPAESTEL